MTLLEFLKCANDDVIILYNGQDLSFELSFSRYNCLKGYNFEQCLSEEVLKAKVKDIRIHFGKLRVELQNV